MPKVGKGNKAVHYPYSKKGMKDAMAHSKRTGEPMSIEYGYGGPVKKYPGGGMVKPMYRHGGAVPMNNQNNQNVNMHHNKNEEVNERLKRIVAQQVMGGKPNMANQGTSNPSPMNNMDDYQSSQKADIQFLMNELAMPYAKGGKVLSPEQKIALAKMMYGGKVSKKSKKKKK